MSNQLVEQKVAFSQRLNSASFQAAINNAITNPKRKNMFTTSIISAVSSNEQLAECDAESLLTAALIGEALQLSPSPQLGYFYMVPFQPKKYNPNTRRREPAGLPHAQFILGYKGYIQLAIRSGQYKTIDIVDIKAGEYKDYDYLTGGLSYDFITDFEERENAETVGYYARFETINGFTKAIYWSKEQMLVHADKYSPAFSRQTYVKLQNGEIKEQDKWKFSSFWYKDFDAMAQKTMLRQLISKWGIMSVEMQSAFEQDENFQGSNVIESNTFERDPQQQELPEEVNLSEL